MGLTAVKGYYIGTAFKRKDIKQIKQAIEYVKERAELLGKDTTYTFAKLFK
jgi:tetrahydromethanopterin S-methyltransferase subunit F